MQFEHIKKNSKKTAIWEKTGFAWSFSSFLRWSKLFIMSIGLVYRGRVRLPLVWLSGFISSVSECSLWTPNRTQHCPQCTSVCPSQKIHGRSRGTFHHRRLHPETSVSATIVELESWKQRLELETQNVCQLDLRQTNGGLY